MRMSDLRKIISSAFNSQQPDRAADALISNVLNKYGISESTLKNLSPNQKEKIRRITSELHSKINNALK
ncbi:spore coat protein [Priestia megaterium]|uniref:spore coat protein n=1 Tax=Priestia megaterium TaxID=1404 RepID=UPI003EECFEAB